MTGFGEQSELWRASWARLPVPARRAVLDAAEVGPGTRLLDLGCGSGELLALAQERGAQVSGLDLAPEMVEHARAAAPGSEVRVGDITALPWPDASFDVVTAINAVQFADDPAVPLAEAARVVAPDGLVAVANWGPPDEQDFNVITAAMKTLLPDPPPLRSLVVGERGALERLLGGAGLDVVAAGEVDVPWETDGNAELLAACEFNVRRLDLRAHAERATITRTLLDAAVPYRRPDGSYRLDNVWLYAVARRGDRADRAARAASTAAS